jgi:hypothetical protein
MYSPRMFTSLMVDKYGQNINTNHVHIINEDYISVNEDYILVIANVYIYIIIDDSIVLANRCDS